MGVGVKGHPNRKTIEAGSRDFVALGNYIIYSLRSLPCKKQGLTPIPS